jgi:hypothetical protein
MVKAELTIEFRDKDEQLLIGLDLLKREDWTEEEFQMAQSVQESVLMIIDMLKGSGLVKEVKREIIK